MPSNLTDSPTWSDQSAPVGADIRNAASVRNALQTAANRAAYIKARGDVLPNLAALTALVISEDDAVRHVFGLGDYVLRNMGGGGGMLATDGIFVLNQDAGDGLHQWISSALLLRTPGGLASLGIDGILARAARPGWIANVTSAVRAGDPSTTAQSFAGTSYVDVANFSSTITTGDTGDYRIIVNWRAKLYSASAAYGFAKLIWNDNTTDHDLAEEHFTIAGGTEVSIGGTFVITTSQNVINVRAAIKRSSGGTVELRFNPNMTLQMVEP